MLHAQALLCTHTPQVGALGARSNIHPPADTAGNLVAEAPPKDTVNYESTIRASVAQQFEQMQAQAAADAVSQLSSAKQRDTVNYESTIRASVAQQFEQMQAQAAANAVSQLSSAKQRDTVNYESTIRASVAQQFEQMKGSSMLWGSAVGTSLVAQGEPSSAHPAAPHYPVGVHVLWCQLPVGDCMCTYYKLLLGHAVTIQAVQSSCPLLHAVCKISCRSLLMVAIPLRLVGTAACRRTWRCFESNSVYLVKAIKLPLHKPILSKPCFVILCVWYLYTALASADLALT